MRRRVRLIRRPGRRKHSLQLGGEIGRGILWSRPKRRATRAAWMSQVNSCGRRASPSTLVSVSWPRCPESGSGLSCASNRTTPRFRSRHGGACRMLLSRLVWPFCPTTASQAPGCGYAGTSFNRAICGSENYSRFSAIRSVLPSFSLHSRPVQIEVTNVSSNRVPRSITGVWRAGRSSWVLINSSRAVQRHSFANSFPVTTGQRRRCDQV